MKQRCSSNDPYLIYGIAPEKAVEAEEDKSDTNEANNSDTSTNGITIFKYTDKQVRTVQIGDDTWFVLKDVCDILGIGNSRDSADRLDDDEKGVATIDTLGGKQEMTIVNESGLYSVILLSRKPEAKAFKRWITHEVLPQIRKTGKYEAKPKTTLEMLEEAVAAIKEKEAQVAKEKAEKRKLQIKVDEHLSICSIRRYNIEYNGSGWNLKQCQSAGKKASRYCRAIGVKTERILDPLFGEVNGYPIYVLEELFGDYDE